MLGANFRPWGTAEWLFPKLSVNDWLVVGSVATEDRCTAALEHVAIGAGAKAARFFEIEDPTFDLTEECDLRRKVNAERFDRLAGRDGSIVKSRLMDSPLRIQKFLEKALADGFRNVLIDISCLPKRFFFPMVKLALKQDQFENIVVTYSTAEKYSDDTLAFEPQEWSHLPLFQQESAPPAPRCSRVIVGVGFLPFRLPELLKHDYQDADAEIILILPFPPGPPQFQRNWQFVHEIDKACQLKHDRQIIRIDAYDVPGCFDRIAALADEVGAGETIFAPFGPKVHSLAMCLYASKFGCDVYYTQPKHYHPRYSEGIRRTPSGKPETYAYSLKLSGRTLY